MYELEGGGMMIYPHVYKYYLLVIHKSENGVHVHNNRINFQKTDGVLVIEGQLLVTVRLQVAAPLSH